MVLLDSPNFICHSLIRGRLYRKHGRGQKIWRDQSGVWGSTIGLLVGPFVIPFVGILIGPFIGAFLAEIIVHKKDPITASKIGLGSVIGFISSVITKGIIQLLMIAYFLFVVFS